MGHRTNLHIGWQTEIEANNLIPINWLPIFSPSDLEFEDWGEDGTLVSLVVKKETALARLFQFSDFLKAYDSYRKYFRPLDIILSEIMTIKPDDMITLNISQFWHVDESNANHVIVNLGHFSDIIVGDRQFDAPDIDVLINRFSMYKVKPVGQLSAADRMHVLFGTYWGDLGKESLYCPAYFGDGYWQGEEAAQSAAEFDPSKFNLESIALFDSVTDFLNSQK
ncbi:MAG: hypothetical protein AAF902_21595 [Chloroflexota bacterium]